MSRLFMAREKNRVLGRAWGRAGLMERTLFQACFVVLKGVVAFDSRSYRIDRPLWRRSGADKAILREAV